MLTLVFDTETTGLPPKKKADKILENMPYIIQLAAILYDGQRPVGHFSCMVQPVTPLGSGRIPREPFWKDNRLLEEDIKECWLPTELALTIFHQYVCLADRIVAHNTKFDRDRVEDTLTRLDANSTEWSNAPKFCTMQSLTEVLKIPSPWGRGFKWPNLDEAYRALVDPAGFEDAHDAMADVAACAKVLFAMEDRGIPLLRI